MSRTPQQIIEYFIRAADIAIRAGTGVTITHQEAAVIASQLEVCKYSENDMDGLRALLAGSRDVHRVLRKKLERLETEGS